MSGDSCNVAHYLVGELEDLVVDALENKIGLFARWGGKTYFVGIIDVTYCERR